MITVALVFVVTLVFGLPIAFALGITGTIQAAMMENPRMMVMLPQRMFAASDNFSLMPFLFLFWLVSLWASVELQKRWQTCRAL